MRWLLLALAVACAAPRAAWAQGPASVVELERRVAADPHDPGAAYDLALAYHAAYDVTRAIDQYRRAQILDPTNGLIHTSLQAALTEWGLLKDSLARFQTSFSQARHDAGAAFNLALAAERHGLIEEAIFHYRRYLALAPMAHDRASVDLRVRAMDLAIAHRAVRILRLTAKPAVVHPGTRAMVVFSYGLRGWGKRNRTSVIERVSLYRGDVETHRFVQRSVRATERRYTARMEILVPPDAAPGPYSLIAEVAAGSRSDDQITVFTIAPRPLPAQDVSREDAATAPAS